MAGGRVLRTSVAGALVALLVAGGSACGEVDDTATAAASSPSSSTEAPPEPAPLPTGALTFDECPEYKSSGVHDHFDGGPGEPWETEVARYVRQTLRYQHPDASARVTTQTDDSMEVTFVDRDGRRVARLLLGRAATGWRTSFDEMCSTGPTDRPARHY